MLRLSDFVGGRKRFYNLSGGLCISASKHCRKMKFRTHSSDTSKEILLILSRFSDFVTCSKLNIQSEGSISQIWNTVGRCSRIYCSSDTHIHKL